MVLKEKIEIDENELPESPFAKYEGEIILGGEPVDCYVLDTGERVLSLTATMKTLAGINGAPLEDYIGVKALNSYINTKLTLEELIEFSIPVSEKSHINFTKAKGVTSSVFIDICHAYIHAMNDGKLTTNRQKQIAKKCSIIVLGFAKIGLDALIDEATGYQYLRKQDELQIKLNLFIAEELRVWEKTFPDELWEEFGRLTNWNEPLKNRPKYWGKLVIELIYETLDKDVAEWLKLNKPPDKIRWHQQLSENYGVLKLVSCCYQVIGIAKTCYSMDELRIKVHDSLGKGKDQLRLDFFNR